MYECIRDFPKKDLKIVDLIHYLSNKEVVTVVYDDGDKSEELFTGRIEDLTFTEEGCLHRAALCPLDWFEVSRDSTLLIYTSDISALKPIDMGKESDK